MYTKLFILNSPLWRACLLTLCFFWTPGGISVVAARVYEVGPHKEFEFLRDVPFDSLAPGDVVKIYYKEGGYQEKFILRTSGTRKHPIKIVGVPKRGKLPTIDGRNAVQFQKDRSSQEGMADQSGRWLIKVGDNTPADHIRMYNLELRNANNSENYIFNRRPASYSSNGSGVFVKFGKHVVVSGCIIHSCGNGVQTSYAPRVGNVTLDKCIIYDNGDHKNPNGYLEHNVYMCGTNTKIQFCRFGEPHANGNNIKDRGLNTIIRYNWIEGGKNRQIDLVDHDTYRNANAYVYGNVIIQGHKINNRNMIHMGGDSGTSRSGILYFFNNTVVGKSHKSIYFVTRFEDCGIMLINNAFIGKGVLWNDIGRISGSNNWFANTILIPEFKGLGMKGISPGFTVRSGIPYIPCPGSPLIDMGTAKLPAKVRYQPKPRAGGLPRKIKRQTDIGAYEYLF